MNNPKVGAGQRKRRHLNQSLSPARPAVHTIHDGGAGNAKTLDIEKLVVKGDANEFQARVCLQPQVNNYSNHLNSVGFLHRVMADKGSRPTPT